MIKLRDLLPESKVVPGAVEGWLATNGKCYNVDIDHATWAAKYLKVKLPPESAVHEYEAARTRLSKQMYDLGWVRIVILPSKSLVYFDTFDKPWSLLTRSQKHWVRDAAIHPLKVQGEMVIANQDDFRPVQYGVEFGNEDKTIDPEDLD